MKRAAALTITFTTTVLLGCTGMVGDPQEQVATLELRADALGALQATACLALYGAQGCSPYPNPLECQAMSVAIQRDGRTCAQCVGRAGERREVCGGIAEGIPVVCHATPDLSCRQCVDVYGNTVHDSCSRGAQLFRSNQSGWQQLPNGAGVLVEPDDGSGSSTPGGSSGSTPGGSPPSSPPPPGAGASPPSSPTPPGGGENKCDVNKARNKYAAELNKILAGEGLKLSYAPLLDKSLSVFGGFWSYLGYDGGKGDVCKQWLNPGSLSYMNECWSNEPGKCHCRCNPGGATQSCRCARITIAALRAVCAQIPPECDHNAWVGAFAMEYGIASAWLNSSSYTGNFFGNIFTPGSSAGALPSCVGSPLVLDLNDDGIEPTGPGQVAFDLLGQGRVRSAWVRGDDALLVLDRNGNGLVDDGTELFGEATVVDGHPARDGFRALAALDRPAEGGNGNGLLEADDLMFGELGLWTDRNGDGISQAGELTDLAGAGIRSIEVSGVEHGRVTDRHGNDLSLRAGFTRVDGRRGLVVDVLFRVH